jgi:hypothetical protein
MTRIFSRFIAILSLAVCLAACGPRINQEDFNKISNGMTYAEVVKVLGEPTSSESGGAFGITAGASVWRDDKNQISIVFVNEKVASKSFGAIAQTAPAAQ